MNAKHALLVLWLLGFSALVDPIRCHGIAQSEVAEQPR
jgi:hypothetical protein